MEKWKTKISLGKTHYLVINNSKKRNDKTDLVLQYNGQQILQQANPILLGYYLDEQLNYHYHLTQIIGKLKNKLPFFFGLKRTDWESNAVTLIRTYKSIIRSITDYSAIAIIMMTPEGKEKLEIIQNKAMCLIAKVHQID
eukprot:Pgem_evm1s4150